MPSAKIFSAKFGGVPQPHMICFKQSVKVFSATFSLPTDPRKFSPLKVSRYTVSTEKDAEQHACGFLSHSAPLG